jgi:hypothetical protein
MIHSDPQVTVTSNFPQDFRVPADQRMSGVPSAALNFATAVISPQDPLPTGRNEQIELGNRHRCDGSIGGGQLEIEAEGNLWSERQSQISEDESGGKNWCALDQEFRHVGV